jgi:hypothetical protein
VTNHSLFIVCSCSRVCSWIVFLVVTDAVVAVIAVVITHGGLYKPNPTSKNTVQQLVMQWCYLFTTIHGMSICFRICDVSWALILFCIPVAFLCLFRDVGIGFLLPRHYNTQAG